MPSIKAIKICQCNANFFIRVKFINESYTSSVRPANIYKLVTYRKGFRRICLLQAYFLLPHQPRILFGRLHEFEKTLCLIERILRLIEGEGT